MHGRHKRPGVLGLLPVPRTSCAMSMFSPRAPLASIARTDPDEFALRTSSSVLPWHGDGKDSDRPSSPPSVICAPALRRNYTSLPGTCAGGALL